MATFWGSNVHAGGGVYIDVGLVVSITYPGGALDTTDTVAYVHWKAYVRFVSAAGYAEGGADPWALTGSHSASGTASWRVSGNNDTDLISSGTDTVSLVYGASRTWQSTFKLSDIAGTSNSASVVGKITIPARPYAKPAAPTGLSATRETDSRIKVAWTRQATTAAPYEKIEVWRSVSVNGLDNYSQIALISGSSGSYIDTKTRSDRRYKYWIRARNSAGTSAIVEISTPISTTPATPSAPTVKKTAGGITIYRPSLSDVATHWEIEHATNGVWDGSRLALLTAGTASYPHPSPSPTATHAYRVKAVSSNPTIYSDWSVSSATIQLIAPPLAPTDLDPPVIDGDTDSLLVWAHNPVDTSDQRQYEIETRLTPADPWVSLGVVVSAVSEHLVPAGTWINGESREWRVRTWGEHANPSPYSAASLLNVTSPPVAGIIYPNMGTHDSQRLTAGWSYYDVEGTPQAGFRVTLTQGESVAYAFQGEGEATSHDLDTSLDNGGTYTLSVEVVDGNGMWSVASVETFTVTYAPPAAPALAATWLPDEGYVALTVTIPAPVDPERPLASLRIERATEDGWVTVVRGLTEDTSVTDMIPPTGTLVTYRAVTTSDIGSEATSAPVLIETMTDWVFINYGPGWGNLARVWGNLKVSRARKREKVLRQYANRPRPVVRGGTARSETYSLSATLFAPWAEPDPSSSWDDLSSAEDALVVCLRDPQGVKLFCTIQGSDLSDALDIHQTVSLPLTVVDYSEDLA